jgi:hypothetical protein
MAVLTVIAPLFALMPGTLLDSGLRVLLGLVAVAFLAAGLLRRSRTLVTVGVAVLVALSAAILPVPDAVPPALRSPVAYATIAVALGVTWVALTHEPSWLAARLGFPPRNREREFDRQVSAIIEAFNDVVRGARESKPAQQRLERRMEIQALMASLRQLHAPSPAWQQLVLEVEALMTMHLETFGEPTSERAVRDFLARNARLTEACRELRARYQAEGAKALR